MLPRASIILALILGLMACSQTSPNHTETSDGVAGSGSNDSSSTTPTTSTTTPAAIDKSCDDAVYPSAEWNACEQSNFAKTNEGPSEFSNTDFQAEYQRQSAANNAEWLMRAQSDPSWVSPISGNTGVTPLCATWSMQCVSDPFQYPESSGSTGAAFYANEAEVTPVVFFDQDCARLSGRIWKPRTGGNIGTGPFPGIVIQNGSVQAPETAFWWAAQALVRAGYMVMTYDPRGQGRSDFQTPTGVAAAPPNPADLPTPSFADLRDQIPSQGTNVDPPVYWQGMVNAVDYFRSSADNIYPHNADCASHYPTTVISDSNPHADELDLDRLGIAGHSLGGVAVSVLQSYGAPGADPWPGLMDTSNPVDAVVAWDGIYNPDTGITGNAGGSGAELATVPAIVPQFPTMGHNGEYGLSPMPFTEPPDPESTIDNFRRWQTAGVPVYEIITQGSTHYDFSPLPNFPTTSWCPTPEEGVCNGGWTNALTRFYTVAWFDRWLKLPGEMGFDDADNRLLDDDGPEGRTKYSFRFRSARDYPDRNGRQQLCLNIRAGCVITR